MKYEDLLKSKIRTQPDGGFKINQSEINPICLPHQIDTIQWGVRKGKALIGSSFGLGKTFVQIELLRIIQSKEGGKVLFVCPLGVKHQFTEADGPTLGINIQYVRTDAEVAAANTPFLITNYERVRDGGITPSQFTAITLDEGSVLRSLGSGTCQTFIEKCANIKYRFVATATPSPNEYNELLNYAHFLGVMDRGQALTRWFMRNSEKAGDLQLYPGQEKEFWLWVSSWALFLTKPSDLGYSDEGYDLPELDVHWHRITDDYLNNIKIDRRDGQSSMFNSVAGNLPGAAKEKRRSLQARIAKAHEIINDGHWLLWHHLEDERKAIEQSFPTAITVYGSQDLEQREEAIIGFSKGEFPILATKPEIAGSGCNFQRYCHQNIFVGIDYRFEDFIQAIHRTHRFQQKEKVQVHIIYTEAEEAIRKALEEKWARHYELQEKMREIIREYGLSQEAAVTALQRTLGVERKEVTGKMFKAVHNDSVHEVKLIDTDSIGLIHTSIPFGNHYEYSASYNDFGHNESHERFFEQMDYLTPDLLRILQPGRVMVVHVKDRIQYGKVTGTGMSEVEPFHADCIFHYRKHGFRYLGMITIETDVVRENNQTYRLGWSEQCKDGSKMGVGSPEYLLLFRKLPTDLSTAYADIPVFKSKTEYTRAQWQIDARGKWNSSGDRLLTPEEISALPVDKICRLFQYRLKDTVYNYQDHVEIAKQMDGLKKLPSGFETLQVPARTDWVWSDVNRMQTLNSKQAQRREKNHICPLQIDIVKRVITRYSNKGDIVFDPFAGLHTVPYVAVLEGRYGYGSELNEVYWRTGVSYCREAEYKADVPTLFDEVA